eukprot:12931570-Prorocentrum_lima.AAC.1
MDKIKSRVSHTFCDSAGASLAGPHMLLHNILTVLTSAWDWGWDVGLVMGWGIMLMDGGCM